MKAPDYEVAIIGGGVVGCAILHKLTVCGYRCVLLEKESHLITGASSGNSGMAHTGFDAKSSLLETRLIATSQSPLHQTLHSLEVPYKATGAVIVAFTPAELKVVPGLVSAAHAQGVLDVRQLSAAEIYQLEPGLRGGALGGLLVPGEAVIDSWRLSVTLAHQALRLGSKVLCSCDVRHGRHTDHWELTTSRGVVTASTVINAAGLYGDVVEEISQPSSFRIHPRQGQYVVYDKEACQLIKHIIAPIPNEKTKGVLIFPSVYGNLVIGPTAEEVSERRRPQTSKSVLQGLIEYGQKMLPGLKQFKPIGSYAGLRPATEHRDYQIKAHKDKHWITVGGIRSTGVSACLGIAEYVHKLLEEDIGLRSLSNRGLPASSAAAWITNKPSLVLDGAEYHVTHPLMRYGLACGDGKAKL